MSFFHQGRQEDAEEYLGFTLNGLHEEMLALKKLVSPPEDSVFTFPFFLFRSTVTSVCVSVQFCSFVAGLLLIYVVDNIYRYLRA